MEAERTDQCRWTGTMMSAFASCLIRKLLAAEHGAPHVQLPLTNARLASSDNARNKLQVQNIYTNLSLMTRYNGRLPLYSLQHVSLSNPLLCKTYHAIFRHCSLGSSPIGLPILTDNMPLPVIQNSVLIFFEMYQHNSRITYILLQLSRLRAPPDSILGHRSRNETN